MKKLMITAAIAMAAVCSQGASMVWGTGTMYKPDTADMENPIKFSGTKASTSVSAYLFEINKATYDSLFVSGDYDATAAKVFAKYATVNDQGKISVSGQTSSAKTSSNKRDFTDSNAFAAGDEWAKGETAYAAMIMTYTDSTSGKDYYIANLGSYNFVENIDGELKAFGTYEFSNNDEELGTKLAGWTMATAAAPEPTSGLLLLLGVAGLALRRRRA